MPKLHQVIALANGKRSQVQSAVTAVYKQIQKGQLFDGLVRTYRPELEDEQQLPAESKGVQATWKRCVDSTVKHWSQLLNITATQDYANCEAKGTIRVDGKVILADVPVTHLLFLEKHMTDVRTVFGALPVLDVAEKWEFDPNKGYFTTSLQQKTRTRKVPKTLVKYEATEHHPAQTERYDEDVVCGYWDTVMMSGRIPAQDKEKMLERVDKIIEGIKLAREEANQATAEKIETARPIFDYIVNGDLPQTQTQVAPAAD